MALIQQKQININSSGGSGAFLDASGALPVSQQTTLGQYTLYDLDGSNFFDTKGTGTAVNDFNNAQKTLSVSSGQYVVTQTRQSHPYFNGASQKIIITFSNFQFETGVIKRVGYFSTAYIAPYNVGRDGIFLESNGADNEYYLVIAKDGTENKIPRSSWDNQVNSGDFIWNPENFTVFTFDFLFLGGTGVNFYFNNGRNATLVHTYNHANNFANVFVKRPEQPIRYEIESITGTGSLNTICSLVATGADSNGLSGIKRALPYQQNNTSLNVAGTRYWMTSLRLRQGFEKSFTQFFDFSFIAEGNDSIFVEVVYNATLSGQTWNALPNGNSVIEYAIENDGGTAFGGEIVASLYIERRNNLTSALQSLRRLGADLDGNRDTYSIFATPLTNGGLGRVSLQWTEKG